ncbi:MAG: alkaline phosphatase family protein [Methanotrichaceae archaeon]|nr:alkaline phosphatase family protein [Methanotrichaceae archaeon]
MRHVSQVDVAPTIAHMLGISIHGPDGRPIEEAQGWRCQNAVLAIVDSLGCDLYKWLEPELKNISVLAKHGLVLRAKAVSNHTSPAIASILSGLLPEHHGIYDTESAKRSPILSLPEITSSAGMRSAVVMEKGGAEIYEGLIEFIGAVPRTLSPLEFDQEICRLSLEALSSKPRLLVSYFIGIDKAAHNGLTSDGFKEAAMAIDHCLGEIADAVQPGTMMVVVGDHPIHAGLLKRTHDPYCVALIIGRKIQTSNVSIEP